MLLALVCVILLLAVLGAVGRPLLTGTRVPPVRGHYDRAVYRDQLREIERDLARGVLSPEEAGAARLEVQRRLLAVDVTENPAAAVPRRGSRLAVGAALFVLLASTGLYWRLGAPTLPDAPFAARPPTAPPRQNTNVKEAAARLEQKLLADPSKAADWVLYARTESMLGDWQKAADAYKHAVDLGLNDADVQSGYGEMRVMAADGIVSPDARDAFAAALMADTGNAVARFYLALADSQAGEAHKAIDAWVELAAGLPADSPMRVEIARRIAEAAKNGGFVAPPLPLGLAAETNPEQMLPAERDKMIAGMVEKLAAKLKAAPDDAEGWSRLGGAYVVLHQRDNAVDAYDHAAALKPGDPGIKLQTAAALLSGLQPGDKVPPRANALLAEVAAVAPDAPEVLWYLGVVAVRDGRVADARDKWTKLLTSLPADGEDAKLVRSALDELKGK